MASRKQKVLLLAMLTFVSSAIGASNPSPAFKVYVEDEGVYRLTFADVSSAGLDRELVSDRIVLTVAGVQIPIWIHDGGDGFFGEGDWLEFVGSRLAGEVSYLNEHSRFNVYRLSTLDADPGPEADTPRVRMIASTSLNDGLADPTRGYRSTQHLEQDSIILRLRPTGQQQRDELWYWVRLDQLAKTPHSETLHLPQLDLDRDQPKTSLRLGFRGWSEPRRKPDAETMDHEVTVTLNGETIATEGWNGTDLFELEIASLPSSLLVRGDNTMGVRVPSRAGADGKELVDVVMLNWIEIEYPRGPGLSEGQARFDLVDTSGNSSYTLTTSPGSNPIVYGTAGARIEPAAVNASKSHWLWQAPEEESTFFVATADQLLAPIAVVFDRQSNLRSSELQADYIIVSHHSLAAAIEPLADFHRQRGLMVNVVDIDDIYDEFEHGVANPRAIRSFLAHAYTHWLPPAPRFVLLVGDASWDAKNPLTNDANYADWTFQARERNRFVKNSSYAYETDADLNDRNLIPTWSHSTSQGHSASDNYFVALEGGGSYLPVMAIGRIPVTEASEVSRIVDKTIRYSTAPEVGPWRRNALFITNESVGFQRQSDRVAGQVSAAGFAPSKVYPDKSEANNELHTQRLIDSFDEGQLFVQFLGHGGRYIWRTGPPDLDKNHDLFTLDHLDQLAPTERLPIVVSLTCYSAPFDHPSADSIGEKLLRVDGRGAIAVFAASWRNSPSAQWGEVLFDQLTTPGATVGEAVMESKRKIRNRMFVETYNLLGDPAVRVALPNGRVKVAAELADGTTLSIDGSVDLDGELIIDLVDAEGDVVKSERLVVTGNTFDREYSLSAEEAKAITSVRAYAWNLQSGRDAAGAISLAKKTAVDVELSAESLRQQRHERIRERRKSRARDKADSDGRRMPL